MEPWAPQWITEYDRNRDLSQKPFRAACYAPFVSLEFGPRGDVRVCSLRRGAGVGDIRYQTIQQVWNGFKMDQLRTYLKHYDLSSGCDRCRWYIDQGSSDIPAKRSYDWIPIPSGSLMPRRFTFRLANTCKVRSVLCAPYSCSVLSEDAGEKPDPRNPYGESFFQELRELLPNTLQCDFQGGDAFLIEPHYRIWDLLISQRYEASISAFTYGTHLDKRVQSYLSALNFSDLVVPFFSLDKTRFETLCQGARMEEVTATLRLFAEYAQERPNSRKLYLQFPITRNTWSEFAGMLEFAEPLNAQLETYVVRTPGSLCALDLPAADRMEMLQVLAKDLERLEGRVRPSNLSRLKEFIQLLEHSAKKVG
ncbi:MAG: SPASM domain-containing protein [Candidatus Omnitrophica bacterium]|nr:SPASM domain-containing protein [Candidatus Omnitrophota bacterium]